MFGRPRWLDSLSSQHEILPAPFNRTSRKDWRSIIGLMELIRMIASHQPVKFPSSFAPSAWRCLRKRPLSSGPEGYGLFVSDARAGDTSIRQEPFSNNDNLFIARCQDKRSKVIACLWLDLNTNASSQNTARHSVVP